MCEAHAAAKDRRSRNDRLTLRFDWKRAGMNATLLYICSMRHDNNRQVQWPMEAVAYVDRRLCKTVQCRGSYFRDSLTLYTSIDGSEHQTITCCSRAVELVADRPYSHISLQDAVPLLVVLWIKVFALLAPWPFLNPMVSDLEVDAEIPLAAFHQCFSINHAEIPCTGNSVLLFIAAWQCSFLCGIAHHDLECKIRLEN